ncbi:hypothetical protein [Cupriavidus metallidurans]|uniref:hypothetical protein n=1 Tax=Cupriavidus metallidurans TaxID=119219 RepID=UPI001CCBCC65|nr:hypothetical protein [Cupriavidus metallidurans]UBM12763.1 hypothetical protein LAI70_27815 [Cupriavidus metallidurans]
MGAPTTYLAGSALEIRVPLIDKAGEPIQAQAVSFRVSDGTGAVINEGVIDPWDTEQTEITLPIPAELNTLEPGVVTDIREIEFVVTLDAGGSLLLSETVALMSQDVLVVPKNSFLTMAEAQMLAFAIPDMTAWYEADRDARVKALTEAHYRLARRRYRTYGTADQRRIDAFGMSGYVFNLTLEAFSVLDLRFITAIKRAQLFEADFILSGEANSEDSTLVSKKVGESTEIYKTIRPSVNYLSARTMREIAPYLISEVRTARA